MENMEALLEMQLAALRNRELVNVVDPAMQRDDHRAAVDSCLQGVVNAPTKWEAGFRWYFFHLATEIICHPDSFSYEASAGNREVLERLSKDIEEPVVFRAQALWTMAFIATQEGRDYEQAAKYCRTALGLLPNADASERSRRVQSITGSGDTATRLVGEILDKLSIDLRRSLATLESQHGVRHVNISETTGISGLSDVERARMLSTGGEECDCCHKKNHEVEGGLLRCSRCKLASYCSSVCQTKRWKAGHKKACRALGQIECGDYVIVKDLSSKPELNGRLARVIGPAGTPGRWEVSVMGLSQSISVAPEKLERTRPAK